MVPLTLPVIKLRYQTPMCSFASLEPVKGEEISRNNGYGGWWI